MQVALGGGGRGLLGKVKVRVEVVDDLSEDSGPVDRVDGAEAVGAVEFGVGEEGFDDVLRAISRVALADFREGLCAWLT